MILKLASRIMHYWNGHIVEAEVECEAKWISMMFFKRLKWEFLYLILYTIAKLNGYKDPYGQDFISCVMEFKEDDER